jgi:hypothetical protein
MPSESDREEPSLTLLSTPSDWCAWQLLPKRCRWKGMTLWAGSGTVLAFSVRSFSNNVEAALLGLSLVAIQRLADVAKVRRRTSRMFAERSINTFSLSLCTSPRRSVNWDGRRGHAYWAASSVLVYSHASLLPSSPYPLVFTTSKRLGRRVDHPQGERENFCKFCRER